MKIRIKIKTATTEHNIPDIATVYNMGKNGKHVIVADYNEDNRKMLMGQFRHVYMYDNKYLLVFFDADAVFGIALRLGAPVLTPAYMMCYRINKNVISQASAHFGKDLSGTSNLTDEQREYIGNRIKTCVYCQKICCIQDFGVRVIRVFSSDKNTVSTISVQRRSPSMAFCWQSELFGISDDDDTIYSEFCTKEEYDEKLYYALKSVGVNDFSI